MYNRTLHIAALFVLVSTCLAACVTPGTPVTQKTAVDLTWPAPPDQPRIKFIDILSRSDDVEEAPGFLDKLMDEKQRVTGLFQPYSVAVDKQGRVYTVDQPFLKVFDKAGKKFTQIFAAEKIRFAAPIGVAVAPDGTIFVSDAKLKAVIGFDLNNKLLAAIGGEDGCGESILERPTGLAVDGNNNRLYIVDTKKHQVFAYDLKGQYLYTIGERGNELGDFNYPTNIAVAGDGTVYVSDEGNFRVQLFDTAGKAIKSVGRIGTRYGEFARPKGVAVDSEGHIYVVDAAFQNFQIFNRDGKLLLYVGSGGSEPGKFSLPTGIFIDGDDRIYVVDRMNSRIQIFQYLGEKWKQSSAAQARQAEPQPQAGKNESKN